MVINQGDVYWLDLDQPFGSAPGYRRPFVVIQNNALNHGRINTVLLCALTTNLRRATALGNVLLQAWEAELPKQSVVVISQIFTVDKSRLDEYIGTLSSKRVPQILDGLKLITEPSNQE
jgi:mRNA interferase MazF